MVPDKAEPLSGVDAAIPNVAGMWDYYLGGNANTGADREAARLLSLELVRLRLWRARSRTCRGPELGIRASTAPTSSGPTHPVSRRSPTSPATRSTSSGPRQPPLTS